MRGRLVALVALLCAVAALPALRAAAPARAVPVCDTACSDLSVTVSGPDSGHVGVTVEYDIVVENEGPSGTPDALLSNTLPDGAALVSASTTQGSCDDAPGGVLTCDLGPLNYPGLATIALTVLPRTAGSNLDSASVQSALSDPVAGNNQDESSGSMSLGLGAVFSKTGPVTATNNTPITYTLVTQLPPCLVVGGTCTSGTVIVTDTLPAGETFLSVTTAPSATCTAPAVGAGGTITCTWSNLDITGGPTTLTETLVVQLSTSAATITNSATQSDDFFGGESSTRSAITALVTAQPVQTFVISGLANLTLTAATKGCGSVTPAGTYAVYLGLNVVMTATPCSGSVFTGWTGGPCSGTTINPCDVAISTPSTITANFAP